MTKPSVKELILRFLAQEPDMWHPEGAIECNFPDHNTLSPQLTGLTNSRHIHRHTRGSWRRRADYTYKIDPTVYRKGVEKGMWT